MKKTALTQLIDELDNGLWNAREVVNHSDDYHTGDVKNATQEIRIIEGVIEIATDLLKVERQGIEDACNYNKGVNGWENGDIYFEKTFKQ